MPCLRTLSLLPSLLLRLFACSTSDRRKVRISRKLALLSGLALLLTASLLSPRANAQDGANPQTSLIQTADGFFYGTTCKGGTNDWGTIFRMDAAGNITILHSFVVTDGSYVNSTLTQAYDFTSAVYTPNFYGTTYYGGANSKGTVFHMDFDGNIHLLHSFTGSDGANLLSGLVQGIDGNIWGTASSMDVSPGNLGSIFSITPYNPNSASTFYLKHTFASTEGNNPYSPLLQHRDSSFMGTTRYGGASNKGTIYQSDILGMTTTLYSFSGSDGAEPAGNLTRGYDGAYYGVTRAGGSSNHGTLFKFSPRSDGTCSFTSLALFNYTNGHQPAGGLTLASDGCFYGTTVGGGSGGLGVVYKFDPTTSSISVIHNFAGSDGKYGSGLMQGMDGNLYGTTFNGGLYDKGVAYVMTLAGSETVLHHFGGATITGLSISPSTVTAPTGSTGTVTLSGTIASGTYVFLSSSNPVVASVPATTGAGNFAITVYPVATTTVVTISATYGGVTKTANLTVNPSMGGPGGPGGGPGDPGGGAGTGYSYQCYDGATITREVEDLQLTDIHLPKSMRVDWKYIPSNQFTAPTFEVERVLSGTSTSLGTTTSFYKSDAFNFTFDTTYQYRVRVYMDKEDLGLPTVTPGQIISMGINPATVYHLRTISCPGPWVTINVTPKQSVATDNQAADTRIDPRFSYNIFRDFQFKSSIYRGGLFVGNNNDYAKVGRSYLKFQPGALGSGSYPWMAGSVNSYFTRTASSTGLTVGCQAITNSWTGSQLKWTTAPDIDPKAATARTTLTGSTSAVNTWSSWNMPGEITHALLGSGLFSAGLSSVSEASGGWAYFAKKEFDTTNAPCILYALGASNNLIDLTFNPNPIYQNKTGTGTIRLNYPAPSGGLVVTLSSDNPSKLQVPAGLMIPEGMHSASFVIKSGSVSSDTTVKVTATINTVPAGMTPTIKTAQVTIKP